MLLPRNVCALARVASQDPARFQLEGVYLERKEEGPCATATDGKILAHLQWKEPPWDDYPANGASPEPKPGFAALVHRNAIKSIEKMIPKKPLRPVLGYACLSEVDGSDGMTPLEVSATDLDRTSHETLRPIQGPFPDYGVVFPQNAPNATVIVDAERLLQVAEFICKVFPECKKTQVNVTLALHGDGKAMEFSAESEETQLRALLMPIVAPKR